MYYLTQDNSTRDKCLSEWDLGTTRVDKTLLSRQGVNLSNCRGIGQSKGPRRVFNGGIGLDYYFLPFTPLCSRTTHHTYTYCQCFNVAIPGKSEFCFTGLGPDHIAHSGHLEVSGQTFAWWSRRFACDPVVWTHSLPLASHCRNSTSQNVDIPSAWVLA
jgi:hypothetical protein